MGKQVITRGAQLLEGVGRPVDIAQKLGVSYVTLASWRRGRRRPGAVQRELMWQVLGIPPEAWLTEAERKLLAKSAA